VIPQIDADLRRWADYRASFTPGTGGYNYRSPLQDIHENRGAPPSGGAIGPSAPRAWGIASRFHFGMMKIEHGVRFELKHQERRAVLLRYTGFEEADPCWRRQSLSSHDICVVLGCQRDTYKETLHRAHSRIERYLWSRTPLTTPASPPQNPRIPARVG